MTAEEFKKRYKEMEQEKCKEEKTMSDNIKQELFVVVWQNEETWVYTSEEKAIKQVESLTGKKQSEWAFDNGDNDEDGRVVYYTEAIWGE